MNCRKIGNKAEEMAAAEIEKRGCHILNRNYRCPQGEIDLIYKDGDVLVFAEVKYRRNLNKGWPEEAVDTKKQKKIRRTAMWYLNEMKIAEEINCRFDVISIVGSRLVIYENAF